MVLEARPTAPAGEQAPPRPDPAARAPRVAQGVELLGEYEGSGYKKPPYLVRRSDGQTIQLSKLLYTVAECCDGRRTYDEVAAAATEKFGRRLSGRNAKTLVEKLQSLGVVVNDDGSQPVLSKPDSLLALNLRKGVISPRAVRAITTVCYPAFFPPVIVAALAALAVFDYWLFVRHGVAQGVRETVMQPMLFLLMMGLVVVSAFLHECGHATGLRYGGGKPGVMGAGVYIAFPAFYTDVTDAYRLSKAGRLRTDLGGIYFNALFMLGTAAVYFATGFEPLLFLIVVQHVEIAHQLLPLLRLDGYYIVADAVGVPDLFTRIGPILKSLLPGRKKDPRVTELKRWVRVFVTTWVLVVVPFLLFNLGLLLVHLPRLLGTGVESMRTQGGAARDAFSDGNWLMAGGSGLQMLILLLPFVGIVYTLVKVFARVGRRSWAWSADSYGKRAFVLLAGAAVAGLLAWAWLPGKQYEPIRPGERGTFSDYVAASHTVLVDRDSAPAFVPAGVQTDDRLDTGDTGTDDGSGAGIVPAPTPVPSSAPEDGTGDTTTGTTGTSPTPYTSPSAAVEPEPSLSPSASPTPVVTSTP